MKLRAPGRHEVSPGQRAFLKPFGEAFRPSSYLEHALFTIKLKEKVDSSTF